MQSLKGTSGGAAVLIKEYTSRATEGPLVKETIITRIYSVPASGHPPIGDIPDSADGLAAIMASWEDGLCKVEYTFQGLPSAGGGGGSAGSSVDETYELQAALTQEPITSHHKIGLLRKEYAEGFKDSKVLWTQTLASGGTNGTDRDGNYVSNLNPFANVDSYLEATATYTISKTYPYQGIDLRISKVGKIASAPVFGEFPSSGTNEKRNWLYAGAAMTQRGNSYTYSIKYLLSGPGGWNPEIYS
jgi:hypothetical protein